MVVGWSGIIMSTAQVRSKQKDDKKDDGSIGN
jgi:hypothetical protein